MSAPHRRQTMLALVVTALLAAANVPAFAEEPHTFDIRPADPARAIQDFGTQSGIQILASADQLRDTKLHGVAGSHTTDAALTMLLADTGLTHKYVGDRTVALVQADQRSENKVPGTQASTAKREQLAQPVDAGRSTSAASDRQPEPNIDMDEIVVTGTHIRGAEPIGARIQTFDRGEIESGYGKLQDFVETLPQNFTGVSEDYSQTGVSNTTRGSEIQLRGLGPGTTLTLVNGHRQAAGGALGAFVDISSIPTSAIERVEILADGASAIYGSDAIGGVVNVVLRDDFEGMETSARFGTADGEVDDVQIGQLFGTRWDSGHVLGGYQYSQRDPLLFGSRSYLAANGDQRRFGGSDWRRDAVRRGSNPGNVVNAAGSIIYAIPRGQDGTDLTVADLLPGQVNYFDSSQATVSPEQEIHSAFLNAGQAIGDRMELDFDARFSERDSRIALPGGSVTTVSVPSTNPFYVNPFGGAAPVRVEYDFARDFGGLPEDLGHTRTYGANFGGTVALTDSWDLRVTGGYAEESVEHQRTNLRDSAATTAALADTNTLTALNVFGDGSFNNPATIDRIRISRLDRATSSLWSAGLIVDGPLFRLAGRAAQLAVGVDHRSEDFEITSSFELQGQTSSDRDVSAVFAEIAVPLLGRGDSDGTSLALSLAGRLDDYSDVGSTFNPKVGMSWQPIDMLKLRGTWGTAFRAPPFYLSNEDIRTPRPFVTTVPDPSRGPGATTTVLARSGVVPNLKEETAEVWTAGVDLIPVRDLSVSLTYFEIAYQDRIQVPGSIATLLTFENQYAGTGVILRNPTQMQINEICNQPGVTINCAGPFGAIVDNRLRNMAEVNVSGLDLVARYSFKTSLGELSVGMGGTYTFEFEEAVTESAEPIDFVDTFERPLSLRLRGNVGWELEGWHANAAVSYSGSYEHPATRRRVDSWTTVDLSAGYTFGSHLGWISGVRALLATTNVLNKRPPFVDHLYGYDSANSSIIGRTVSFQVVKQW